MTGDVSHYYERLEPRERMIAAIAAAARTDDQEVDRLVRSCPDYKHVQAGLAFTHCMRAVDFVTTALAVELGPHLRTLIVLDSVCDYLDFRSDLYTEAAWLVSDAAFWQGVQWGWARAGRNDDPPDPNEVDDELPPNLDAARLKKISADTLAALRQIAADLAAFSRGTFDGFGQWASDEGLDPLALVAAFAGYLSPGLEAARPLLDAAEPDPEVVEPYADLFRALWSTASDDV
jgi:hypothetical protein